MTHDAIVIGAGPAGATAAIELARQGRSVAIVEKVDFPRRKVCGEFLSATSIPVLRRLGIEAAWRDRAGPEVRRVALFAGERIVEAPMPSRAGFGRALGRDVLDTLLLNAARRHGVEVHQPCRPTSLDGEVGRDGRRVLTIDSRAGRTMRFSAPLLIAAHGSWERGPLSTQLGRTHAASDLLAFKAHFRGAAHATGTMPLLAFPGGYGGMVWADEGRLSLSCCIRRDKLAALRQGRSDSASEVLDAHLRSSCRGAREVLAGAQLTGPWLAAGPIRPGIRPRYSNDIFRVGNLAGEAHPVIAEGISMAFQSAALLADVLQGVDATDPAKRADAGRRYAAAWLRLFALRLHAARTIAFLSMRPAALQHVAAIMPSLLTIGARLSGKAKLSLQS